MIELKVIDGVNRWLHRKVNHSGVGRTPHLQLWATMYGIQAQLNYTISPGQLALLDGISLWQNDQPTTGATEEDTLDLLAHSAQVWPGPRLASGTIVTGGFGFGWAPPENFRTVLSTSLRELRKGNVDNALLYNAKGLLAANQVSLSQFMFSTCNVDGAFWH